MTEAQKLLSDFKFYSSYSKYLKDEERMETWEESVDRVMKMHYEKYADKISQLFELRSSIKHLRHVDMEFLAKDI